MWNYVYFKAYIYKKQTPFNGYEAYVKGKMLCYDVSWFPVLRALEI